MSDLTPPPETAERDSESWLDYLAEEGLYEAPDDEPLRCEEFGCGRVLPCREHG